MASTALPHEEAVSAFVEEVEEADIPALQRLVLFGSVARATHGSDSDVDVLAIVDDGTDRRAIADRLRNVAYDVMLEYGVAFSIHAVTESTLEDRSDHPFFSRVASDGAAIYG